VGLLVNLNQQDKVVVAEVLLKLDQMVEMDNLLLQVMAEVVQQLTYQVHQ
tara:strand:- start:107 stop:256 length:150 start_codon:yes stop_codon:yes gene_type:complete